MRDDPPNPFTVQSTFEPATGPDFSTPAGGDPPPRERKKRTTVLKRPRTGPLAPTKPVGPQMQKAIKRGERNKLGGLKLDAATALKIASGLKQEDLDALAGAIAVIQALPKKGRARVAAALAKVFAS